FIWDLNLDIGGAVWIHYPQTLAEAIEKAYIAEETRGKTQQARDRVQSCIQQMQDSRSRGSVPLPHGGQ
ncbi:hypothetical protein KI387_036868, partial [Taxus chinensis]